MPRGLFTQCLCLLTQAPPTIEQLQQALGSGQPADKADHWATGGEGLVYPYKSGRMVVDIVEHRWVDAMGDPKSDPELFAAWTLGNFGPGTYPGALERATQQAWGCPTAEQLAEQHTGFLRLRTLYRGGPEDPILPEDYNPVEELTFVTEQAARLATLDSVTAYFNPNGEVLREPKDLEESLKYNRQNNLPHLDLWTNVRMFDVPEDWTLMDVVGLEQLMLPDLEAIFSQGYDPNQVERFLRSLSQYLLANGEVFGDGDVTAGPGGIEWQVSPMEEGLAPPPRRVLGWLPRDGRDVPAGL